jgi:class 3 adenylate cyclase
MSREWTLDAPVGRVWTVLAQTDKLNRAVGLPPVRPTPMDGKDLGRRVEAWLYGVVPMSWVEYPFEWVRDRRYSVQRDYLRGPLTRFRGGVEVEPAGSGSRVRVSAELTPRNLLGLLAIPFVGRRTLNQTWDYCRKTLEREAQTLSAPLHPLPSRRREIDAALLSEQAARLERIPGLDRRVIAELARHLAEAGDEDVVRMQPYALAARWGTARHDTLRVFLQATRLGLLNLSWALMCPHCRVPKAEAETFSLVTSHVHCDTCGIDYEANLDRYVELRFRIHPGIRSARDEVFCFGGPYSAAHILVQHLLRPGETRDVSLALEDEAYRIRVLRLNQSVQLAPASTGRGGADFTLTYRDGGWTAGEAGFRPGPVRLRWINESSDVIGAVLERVKWDEFAAPAAEVTALQEFRDLFGSEVLTPGQEIGVESVTIVFSDLKESTRLYEQAGDAPAYGHVRRHFDFLRERIARHRGAVVKTIGDAVMAVFHLPDEALRCCLEIQRDLQAFNGSQAGRSALIVKLGMHHGPAIAINANGRLDYFGRTVNVASRVLRESQGGDVVLAKSVLEDPRVREAMEREKASVVAEWTSTLRGVTEPLPLCRVVGSYYTFPVHDIVTKED